MEDKLSGLVALAILLMGFVGLPIFFMKIWGKSESAARSEGNAFPDQREEER